MNLLWFLGGMLAGGFLYHEVVPLVMKRLGRDKDVLRHMVRGLGHDSFINLRGAVEEESKRRKEDDPQAY